MRCGLLRLGKKGGRSKKTESPRGRQAAVRCRPRGLGIGLLGALEVELMIGAADLGQEVARYEAALALLARVELGGKAVQVHPDHGGRHARAVLRQQPDDEAIEYLLAAWAREGTIARYIEEDRAARQADRRALAA